MLRYLAFRPVPAARAGARVGAARRHSTESRASTFGNQERLPRLPIPTLEATAARYLKSLRPLLSGAEYAQSERAVASFIGSDGLGPVLQQRLHKADKQAAASWLEDIWLNKAYLEWREPNFINANWAALLADSADAPVAAAPRGQTSGAQLARAARMTALLLDASDAINAQALAADTQRGAALCMNQFKWQFGTTRIARAQRDELVHQWPATARHILVMYRDCAVKVPVYGGGGRRASLAQLAAQLDLAVRRVDERLAQEPAPAPVARLTAGNRDNWAQARELLAQDAANREALATADTALFGVCLDVDLDPRDAHDAERSLAEFTHGGGGANRWFDKAVQLVVLNSGRLGVNCEHTPADALTTGSMLMAALAQEAGPVKDRAPCADLAEPAPVRWTVSPAVARHIEHARAEARALAANLRILLGRMPAYGAQWIKALGVSPDAYFQVALQAAYFRHHGRPAPTYETASLRRFLHGRTETIRSCSEESLAFSRAFDDRGVAAGAKLRSFQRAVAAHVDYSRAAAAGQGVDRHLLGLRAQIRTPDEAARAALFQDPAYARSMSFALSTSNVTPGDKFRGGFAPVVADGYGVNYALDAHDLKFSVSEWRAAPDTDAAAFRETICQTLRDIRAAAEQAMPR
ncbi:hypothetical protein LPJ63_000048 [Coemansia sp. RSA 2711]|nr:hypothetical protein LPJ63_000048 [Coemansia sp. RSA 2711]